MSAVRTDAEAGRGAWPYLALEDAALLAQCEVDTYRASGPGGQKRNKTDSAVRLRHGPTSLVAIGTESRSQHENKARALRRLRKTIALSLRRSIVGQNPLPTALLASCVSSARGLQVGQKDHRFLHVVAEILDLLAACDAQLSTTAALLGVTTANLGSFLGKDPAVLESANRLRSASGLKPLR